MSRGASSSRHAVARVTTRALLLRTVPVGESDLMLTLFTHELGTTAAAARGARKSSRRFGAIEPLHELLVALDVRDGSEIAKLAEARIGRPRLGITRSLERMEIAGQLLRWLRRACPPHIPEPSIFESVSHGLDALDDLDSLLEPRAILGAVGLSICDGLGWGLDLDRCVGCGKACPPTAPSAVDPHRGGLVCRACGGARRVLSSEARAALRSAGAHDPGALDARAVEVAIDLVDAVLDAHVGPAPTSRS